MYFIPAKGSQFSYDDLTNQLVFIDGWTECANQYIKMIYEITKDLPADERAKFYDRMYDYDRERTGN